MDPLVSIIIPVYNVEDYLDRCVQSVVNQTYKNLEIILVDDGSPDNCPQMCDDWAEKDSRIRVIHKENAGLGMARNTGLDTATGEYICFFDSDDYVDLATIEKSVDVLLRDNSDAVVFGCVNDYGDKKEPQKLNVKKSLFEGRSIQEELIPSLLSYGMGFGISCCMKVFRTSTINNNSIKFKSEREIISEDAIFILDLFPKTKAVSVIAENLYFYYKNESSLTNQYRDDRQIKNDVWICKALEIVRADNLSVNISRCLKVRYHMYTISAIKQLILSGLTNKEKSKYLSGFFRSGVLRSTLSFDVIKIHKKNLFLFFTFLKLRCYLLCRVLLYLKIKNN